MKQVKTTIDLKLTRCIYKQISGFKNEHSIFNLRSEPCQSAFLAQFSTSISSYKHVYYTASAVSGTLSSL